MGLSVSSLCVTAQMFGSRVKCGVCDAGLLYIAVWLHSMVTIKQKHTLFHWLTDSLSHTRTHTHTNIGLWPLFFITPLSQYVSNYEKISCYLLI